MAWFYNKLKYIAWMHAWIDLISAFSESVDASSSFWSLFCGYKEILKDRELYYKWGGAIPFLKSGGAIPPPATLSFLALYTIPTYFFNLFSCLFYIFILVQATDTLSRKKNNYPDSITVLDLNPRQLITPCSCAKGKVIVSVIVVVVDTKIAWSQHLGIRAACKEREKEDDKLLFLGINR